MLIKENEEFKIDDMKEEIESLKSCNNELNSKLEYSTRRFEECTCQKRKLEKNLALKEAEYEEYSNKMEKLIAEIKTDQENELNLLKSNAEDSKKKS